MWQEKSLVGSQRDRGDWPG
ncbi:hypothetical protein Hamer_G008865 [Homarus americanus]|uniref:Uncharacterized protein n=1 Tax=Homarus americanus TaxID=6706 RepID=A0A8J5JS77_HOMAM|nr:hypothetical protein Hamer_G008865 [Homarus americanus]